ncbi:sensor histidine kinase NtrY-like [Acetobacter sp.]|jgi:two-component system nitrogen regulation sensor histidine kinase NtrY|uniref:sensor histidine kinase NtrY-like n=1 Tax=Acetobacter sp. TaxID=440 RepID=UPI0025C5FF1C|nr:PAS domain-containing sensor histidine kinase [Acetobacter sp.]MCH4090220.1 PAS domain-containing sensor histidine kinase [Acetobacter sp.]MCI1298914.1 PAS domain-containing sensor histidine kinase [Acetobacter sp.]MCI1314934.1 PAS domain-containing sensor histidine kinase [Acetobacter sp.]
MLRRALEMRSVTITLVPLALLLVFAMFVVLSGGAALAHHPILQNGIFILGGATLLLLAVTSGLWVRRLINERQRDGTAGARLHVRLVALFGLVAVAPTIVVGIFATIFFDYGIQIWFSDRVNTALNEALQASRGYLTEHNANIRTEAFSLANFLVSAENELQSNGTDLLHDPETLGQMLDSQATIRGLTEAVVYDPITNKVIAAGGLLSRSGYDQPLPPPAATMMARTNDVAIYDSPDEKVVRAVVALGETPEMMLVITRPVDPEILGHMRKTEKVVADYKRLDNNRTKIQIIFVIIFALVTLLVMLAAALMGLTLARQIARPLGLLMDASHRVSEGDLSVRVPEEGRDDEIRSLSHAFNLMTDELASQRSQLMDAYEQINERRRFTEAVLSGVSAGVIGLDGLAHIELPNRVACDLLGKDLTECVGHSLVTVVPEFEPVLNALQSGDGRVQTQEVQIGVPGSRRVLFVRAAAEMRNNVVAGYVVTFDDITALQSAQRKAAWADVARRIAHEIKNPLTPIQLAAERLKRRFLREITSDPETFQQCADTIVRQVGDIGRMVDEFSAFARMPQPRMAQENLSSIIRDALILQQGAHPEIRYDVHLLQGGGPLLSCDRRQIGQTLTNLLQNAADAIAMTGRTVDVDSEKTDESASEVTGSIGMIRLDVTEQDGRVHIVVTDDGIGLPREDRDRLTEPYVTHKPKGTGLGLAIVKKIMEDHEGTIELRDRPDAEGTEATLILPLKAGTQKENHGV